MTNSEVRMDLEDAVAEVLGLLTGLDLNYVPETDRFRAITRSLNRSLRANALEADWSYYASTEAAGATTSCGSASVPLRSDVRPRIINDDAVRLLDRDGNTVRWAYFLPRDALHKYRHRDGLWCAATGQNLLFSRPFEQSEEGLIIQIPVMREPRMFRLPPVGTDVPTKVLRQQVDFDRPDLIVARGAYFYAQTDPVMQPRVPTLENDYKTLMYQLIERDERHTDTPYMNEFILPLENGLVSDDMNTHRHPHANF